MTGFLLADAAAVAVGAVCGALSRFHAGNVAAEWIAKDPARFGQFQGWHTAGINIAGSFVLGGIAGSPTITAPKPKTTTGTTAAKSLVSSASAGLTPRQKMLLGVGFCGSFTTFSTFSVDVVTWLQQGQTTRAFSYVMTNNVGGIAAAAAGMMLSQTLFGRFGR